MKYIINIAHHNYNKDKLTHNGQDSNRLDHNGLDNFMKYISKMYYSKNNIKNNIKNENKTKYKKCIKIILCSSIQNSQLFMEYLDHHYYKYLEKKYAPISGIGYIKTKKHFESINKQNSTDI
jgi:hypothetical protein